MTLDQSSVNKVYDAALRFQINGLVLAMDRCGTEARRNRRPRRTRLHSTEGTTETEQLIEISDDETDPQPSASNINNNNVFVNTRTVGNIFEQFQTSSSSSSATILSTCSGQLINNNRNDDVLVITDVR